MNSNKLTVVATLAALSLSACAPSMMNDGPGADRFGPSHQALTTNERLMTEAKRAVADGNADEALQYYERLYKKDSNDADTALNYAQVLRKTGKPQRAALVLAPFIKKSTDTKTGQFKKNADISPNMLLEYAAVTIELGDFKRAEDQLFYMLENKQAQGLEPQIHNLLGVSYDARGMHKNAEKHYRQAMDAWQGNPVGVMNNLALNLAHQGYFDESLTLLRQARVMAPDREAVAANIKLVTALKDTMISKPDAITE